jgi:hypothetical protein
MDLPFKTAPQPETHTVGTPHSGTLELPKLYSVTPNEEIQIAEYLRRAGSGNDVAALNHCKCEIAALALSRIVAPADDQPTADDAAQMPLALVDDLFSYLLAERCAWADPEPSEGTDPKSTGASTSATSAPPSPTTTTDSAAAGPSDTAAKTSAKSPSGKSAKATKPT